MKNGNELPIYSQRLKQSRKKAGKTQKEIANELGIAEKTYRSWEVGNYNNQKQTYPFADIQTLPKLVKLLNVDADYLIGTREEEYTQLDNMKIGEITGLSESAINVLRNSGEEISLFLNILLENGYFTDICLAIYSYMTMCKYQGINIADDVLGNKQLGTEDTHDIAEYRASKYFSRLLVDKISKNPEAQKLVGAGRAMESLRTTMSQPGQREEIAKTIEEAEKQIRNHGRTFNELCDDEERSNNETTK